MQTIKNQFKKIQQLAKSLKEESDLLWMLLADKISKGESCKEITSVDFLELFLTIGTTINNVGADFRDIYDKMGLLSTQYHGMDAVKELYERALKASQESEEVVKPIDKKNLN